MVIFTALLSASKARRSDIISAVAPPSFCLGIRLKIMKVRGNHKGMQINSCGKKETWTLPSPDKICKNLQGMPCKECSSLFQCSCHPSPRNKPEP